MTMQPLRTGVGRVPRLHPGQAKAGAPARGAFGRTSLDPRDAQPALRGVLNVAWHPEHGFERGRYAVDAQEASVVG